MTPSSLAGHVIELIEKIGRSSLPADKVVADFYKERRYLGSHDRKWISDRTFTIVRNFLLLKDLVNHCGITQIGFGLFLANEIRLGQTNDSVLSGYSQLFESYRAAGSDLDFDRFRGCAERRLEEIGTDASLLPLLYSFPNFFQGYVPKDHRGEMIPLMEALNHEANVCLRLNSGRITADEAVAKLHNDGIEAVPSKYSPIGIYLKKRVVLNEISLYRSGLLEVQDEASQMVGFVVDPQPGELIVDACAGAGGKSLLLAYLSGGKSNIIALDVDKDRLDNLRVRAKRAGIPNIEVKKVAQDDLHQAEELISSADKVLIDAPCSGSGTIRRNPDRKFRLSIELSEEYADRQQKLIRHYSRLVRPGGFLFYATCSLFEIENKSVADLFLESNRQFERLDLSDTDFGRKYPELIEDGCMATYPHKHDMDGFFCTGMKRIE